MEAQDEKLQSKDSRSNLLKFDCPIGKLKFFVNSVLIFIYSILGVVAYYVISIAIGGTKGLLVALGVFFLVFIIPTIYLNFVNYTKRIWDICENKKASIILVAALFILFLILKFIFIYPILELVSYFALLLISGKQISNNEDN